MATRSVSSLCYFFSRLLSGNFKLKRALEFSAALVFSDVFADLFFALLFICALYFQKLFLQHNKGIV
jgi:hypothetical protein